MLTTSKQVLRLHASDNVVVAKQEIPIGTDLKDNGSTIATINIIPSGHKIAAQPISRNNAVRKYGQVIGFATKDIKTGEHVHEQNIEFAEFKRDYARRPEYYNNIARQKGWLGGNEPVEGPIGKVYCLLCCFMASCCDCTKCSCPTETVRRKGGNRFIIFSNGIPSNNSIWNCEVGTGWVHFFNFDTFNDSCDAFK